MRHWYILVATTAALTGFAPLPAGAQIAVEVPGVGVRIGEPPRERVIEREPRERIIEREVRGGPSCRKVTVQEETPTGTRTVTREKCD